MFWKYFFTGLSVISMCSCNEKKAMPDSDIDAARTFIKSIQDDDFSVAGTFILADPENKEALSKLKKAAESKSAAALEKYKNAEIIIYELEPVNDSVTIVNYAISDDTSLKNKLKLIKRNGRWLVDLKYTFSGNL
jgi:Domain of unknown function (DUF4878)